MPRNQPSDALSRWLAAERSGLLEKEAEAALCELLGALPVPAPAAGFADRVLARAGRVEGPLALPPNFARWRRRSTRVGAALGLAAAAAALVAALSLPAMVRLWSTLHSLPAPLSASTISTILQAGISAIMSFSALVAGLVSVGNTLLLLVRAVAKPLATLPMAGFALVSLLISVVALRFLYALIQRDRRWVYADPI